MAANITLLYLKTMQPNWHKVLTKKAQLAKNIASKDGIAEFFVVTVWGKGKKPVNTNFYLFSNSKFKIVMLVWMKIGWLRNENGKLHNYNLDNKCSQLFLRLPAG